MEVQIQGIMNQALATSLSILGRQDKRLQDAINLLEHRPVTITGKQMKWLKDELLRADNAMNRAKMSCLEVTMSLHNQQERVHQVLQAVDDLEAARQLGRWKRRMRRRRHTG